MIGLDGDNPRAFYLQAVLAARMGKDNLARRLMWRTGNALDGTPAVLLFTGIIELRAGNTSLAVEALARLVRLQPDNARANELFARALLANGEESEVVGRYGDAARREDASPYLQQIVGRAYEALDRRGLAGEFLDLAARAGGRAAVPLAVSEQADLVLFRYGNDPYRLDAAIARARQLLSQGQHDEARAAIELLGERFGGSQDYRVLAGDVELASGNPDAALEQYRLAAQVRRNFPLSLRMVRAQQQAGRYDAARAIALQFLEQNPLDRDAVWLAAEIAIEMRDWRQARLLLEHIGRLEPGARDPGRYALLALSELQQGELEPALAHAQEAYRMQRMNARANYVLALVLKQAGGSAGRIEELTARAQQMGIGEDPLFRGL